MIFLLISGILVLCAGLLAIVFGIPIKEFSFGNTMIIVGSIVACSGFIQIGLSFVVRELRQLSRGLGAQLPATPDMATARRARDPRDAAKRTAAPRAGHDDMLFTRDVSPGLDNFERDDAAYDGRTPPAISMPPLQSSPPLSEAPFSDTWNDEPSTPPPLPADANGYRPSRDVMFTSRRRGQDDSQPADQSLRADEFSNSDRRDAPDNEFQDAWPQPDRLRAPSAGRDSQGEPPSSPRPPPRRNETSPVTVVKSGVVDAMAYSLYSDGSIEAQTPEGMVRFGSINDLRAHLDQRG